jgi:hypothetical protein
MEGYKGCGKAEALLGDKLGRKQMRVEDNVAITARTQLEKQVHRRWYTEHRDAGCTAGNVHY